MVTMNATVRSLSIGSLSLVLFCGWASAQSPSYLTDFNGENGTQPAGWEVVLDGGNAVSINNNRYRMRRTGDGSGAVMTSAYRDSTALDDWGDYRVEAVLRSTHVTNPGTKSGVFARWDGVTPEGGALAGGYFGYVAAVDAESARLVIEKGLGASNNAAPVLAESQFEFALANTTDYRLSFLVIKDTLELAFYTLDGGLIHSLVVTDVDSPFLVGFAGVRSYQSSSSRETLYSSFSLEPAIIPEPSTVAAFGAAAALAGVMFSRRSRTR